MIHVTLVRAWQGRHESIEVDLPPPAQVGDALAASGWSLDGEHVGLAVFGRAATSGTQLHDGDRVELLRGLECDPKQARRLRAARAKGQVQRSP